MEKICTNCQSTKIKNNYKFCPDCGTQLKIDTRSIQQIDAEENPILLDDVLTDDLIFAFNFVVDYMDESERKHRMLNFIKRHDYENN